MVAGDTRTCCQTRQAAGLPTVCHHRARSGEEAGKALTEQSLIKAIGLCWREREPVRRSMAQGGAPTLKRVHSNFGGKNRIGFDDPISNRALEAVRNFMIYC